MGRKPKNKELEPGDLSPEEIAAQAAEQMALDAAEEGAGEDGGEEELDPDLQTPEPPAPKNASSAWRNIPGLDEALEAKQRADLWEGHDFEIKLYRRDAIPGAPGKFERNFVTSIWNEEIDEAWIQGKGLSGHFIAIRQWKIGRSSFKIQTGYYKILPRLNADPPPVTPGIGNAPGAVQASPGQIAPAGQSRKDFLEELKTMREIFFPAGTPAAPVPAPLPGGFGMEALEKSFERRLKLLDDRESSLSERERKGLVVPKPKQDDTPQWMQNLQEEFMPLAKRWIKRLTRDDETGRDLRQEIVGNPKFREVWGDIEKKTKAVEMFIDVLGDGGALLAQFLEKEATAGVGAL